MQFKHCIWTLHGACSYSKTVLWFWTMLHRQWSLLTMERGRCTVTQNLTKYFPNSLSIHQLPFHNAWSTMCMKQGIPALSKQCMRLAQMQDHSLDAILLSEISITRFILRRPWRLRQNGTKGTLNTICFLWYCGSSYLCFWLKFGRI